MSYRITGLNPDPFLPLFDLPDEDLAARRAKRMIVTEKPGFPCRISLVDAEPGEEVLLLNYEHQPVQSPFRSSHAIYVRRAATHACEVRDMLPPVFHGRKIALRAFDKDGMIVGGELTDGDAAAEAIERLFEDKEVDYLHAHFATLGCFAARVDR